MCCPGKVTKSFELTEKMRKLIENSWFIYIRLESSSCFQEQDVPSTNTTHVAYAEKEQETLKCIFDLFIFTQTDTQSFIQILPFGG